MAGAARPGALVAAHRRALGPGGWAERSVEVHLDRVGVAAAIRPLLVLASRTRSLARLAETPERCGRSIPHPREVLWQLAIEDAERTP